MRHMTHGLHRERKLKCKIARIPEEHNEVTLSWGHARVMPWSHQCHARVTTMEELDQSSLYPLIKLPETDVSRLENPTPAAFVTRGHSTKQLSSQILIYLFGTSTL